MFGEISSHIGFPIGSMYCMFTYIHCTNQPKVGKYTIHGSYGFVYLVILYGFDPMGFISIFPHHHLGEDFGSLLPSIEHANPRVLKG